MLVILLHNGGGSSSIEASNDKNLMIKHIKRDCPQTMLKILRLRRERQKERERERADHKNPEQRQVAQLVV